MTDFYLSGPMTGLPEFNFPAFNAAAESIRARGHTVCNPADFGASEEMTWADYMRRDIIALAGCKAVAVMEGWERSKGANLEVYIARKLGMTVYEAATLRPL